MTKRPRDSDESDLFGAPEDSRDAKRPAGDDSSPSDDAYAEFEPRSQEADEEERPLTAGHDAEHDVPPARPQGRPPPPSVPVSSALRDDASVAEDRQREEQEGADVPHEATTMDHDVTENPELLSGPSSPAIGSQPLPETTDAETAPVDGLVTTTTESLASDNLGFSSPGSLARLAQTGQPSPRTDGAPTHHTGDEDMSPIKKEKPRKPIPVTPPPRSRKKPARLLEPGLQADEDEDPTIGEPKRRTPKASSVSRKPQYTTPRTPEVILGTPVTPAHSLPSPLMGAASLRTQCDITQPFFADAGKLADEQVGQMWAKKRRLGIQSNDIPGLEEKGFPCGEVNIYMAMLPMRALRKGMTNERAWEIWLAIQDFIDDEPSHDGTMTESMPGTTDTTATLMAEAAEAGSEEAEEAETTKDYTYAVPSVPSSSYVRSLSAAAPGPVSRATAPSAAGVAPAFRHVPSSTYYPPPPSYSSPPVTDIPRSGSGGNSPVDNDNAGVPVHETAKKTPAARAPLNNPNSHMQPPSNASFASRPPYHGYQPPDKRSYSVGLALDDINALGGALPEVELPQPSAPIIAAAAAATHVGRGFDGMLPNPEAPVKKRGGRPKGSKNRPPEERGQSKPRRGGKAAARGAAVNSSNGVGRGGGAVHAASIAAAFSAAIVGLPLRAGDALVDTEDAATAFGADAPMPDAPADTDDANAPTPDGTKVDSGQDGDSEDAELQRVLEASRAEAEAGQRDEEDYQRVLAESLAESLKQKPDADVEAPLDLMDTGADGGEADAHVADGNVNNGAAEQHEDDAAATTEDALERAEQEMLERALAESLAESQQQQQSAPEPMDTTNTSVDTRAIAAAVVAAAMKRNVSRVLPGVNNNIPAHSAVSASSVPASTRYRPPALPVAPRPPLAEEDEIQEHIEPPPKPPPPEENPFDLGDGFGDETQNDADRGIKDDTKDDMLDAEEEQLREAMRQSKADFELRQSLSALENNGVDDGEKEFDPSEYPAEFWQDVDAASQRQQQEHAASECATEFRRDNRPPPVSTLHSNARAPPPASSTFSRAAADAQRAVPLAIPVFPLSVKTATTGATTVGARPPSSSSVPAQRTNNANGVETIHAPPRVVPTTSTTATTGGRAIASIPTRPTNAAAPSIPAPASPAPSPAVSSNHVTYNLDDSDDDVLLLEDNTPPDAAPRPEGGILAPRTSPLKSTPHATTASGTAARAPSAKAGAKAAPVAKSPARAKSGAAAKGQRAQSGSGGSGAGSVQLDAKTPRELHNERVQRQRVHAIQLTVTKTALNRDAPYTVEE